MGYYFHLLMTMECLCDGLQSHYNVQLPKYDYYCLVVPNVQEDHINIDAELILIFLIVPSQHP